MPDDGNPGQLGCNPAVDGGLQRVGMDQVGLDLTKTPGKPDRVGERHCRVYRHPDGNNLPAPHISQRLIEGNHFGRDPTVLKSRDQWPLLAKEHVRVDAFQRWQQPEQCDFGAREFGAMIKVDDPRAYARPTSRE